MLHTVLYFHELKNSTQRLSTKFGSVSNITQSFSAENCLWIAKIRKLSLKVFHKVQISRKVFRLRIVFIFQKSENCLWRFFTKFGFSFPLSRKIFRLQFSLIFLRKNRSEAFCGSSENILCATLCGLLTVALSQHQAITNITKHSIQQRIFRRKIRK